MEDICGSGKWHKRYNTSVGTQNAANGLFSKPRTCGIITRGTEEYSIHNKITLNKRNAYCDFLLYM